MPSSVHPEVPGKTKTTYQSTSRNDNSAETTQLGTENPWSDQANVSKPRLKAKECRTEFDLNAYKGHVNKLEKRLQMQAKRLNDKLAFARTGNKVRAQLKI
ncbi:unnamed protein product [Ixodes hexagonus]